MQSENFSKPESVCLLNINILSFFFPTENKMFNNKRLSLISLDKLNIFGHDAEFVFIYR